MLPLEQALWASAREDYGYALSIAAAELDKKGIKEPAVVQSGAATVLIHVQRLRDNNWKHDNPPIHIPVGAGGGHGGNVAPPIPDQPLPVPGLPPCPKCGGAMKVNPERRTEKSPHYLCTQEHGQCGKPSDDGKKWFPTGAWQK